MKTLKNYIIDETIWNLKEREGETVYACDLAYTVFGSANVDGSYTYSTYEAVKWIKKYFDSLGEIVEEMQGQGLNAPNPFDEPEKFQVCVFSWVKVFRFANLQNRGRKDGKIVRKSAFY